jgi:hypothetical protein
LDELEELQEIIDSIKQEMSVKFDRHQIDEVKDISHELINHIYERYPDCHPRVVATAMFLAMGVILREYIKFVREKDE